ncbi:MAG: TonB-dependent receptor [Bdellovibrionales bacterium]|nr:TonB-dependent receptor [Bdellovibrionales bacterium]
MNTAYFTREKIVKLTSLTGWTIGILFMFVQAVAENASADDSLLGLSLEQLMQIEVTGMSKKEDTFAKLPAASYVITEQEIRANTATTLPELLKIVPGLTVSQVNGGRYAVSSRGFHALFSNKILVLVDGKVAYSSLFSSVNWDALDMPLDDIQRIEIYRGPAGTIYGSNAVNGIVNIITKSSKDSSGTFASARVGDLEQVTTDLRHGGELSEDFDYRLSGRFRNQKRLSMYGDDDPDGIGYEGYHMALRIDGELNEKTRSMTHFRFNTGRMGEVLGISNPGAPSDPLTPTDSSRQYGFYFFEEVSHQVSEDLTAVGQFYFDREDREILDTKTALNTLNFEGRALYSVSETTELIAGGTYRYIDSDLNNSTTVNASFADGSPGFGVGGLFGQLDYSPNESWKFSAGMRVENNEYTDFEYMPNIRAAYFPSSEHTLWASVGRATRLPSIVDKNGMALRQTSQLDPDTGLPILIDFKGSALADSEAETLVAYELGYRGVISPSASVDVSSFYYDYTDLQTIEVSGAPTFNPGTQPFIGLPAGFFYNGEGKLWGAEAGVRYAVRPNYSLYASYSYLDVDLSGFGEFNTAFNQEGTDPENKVTLHFHGEPLDDLSFDLFYYFYDNLSAFQAVDAYNQFDGKIRYDLSNRMSVSFVGRNLFESRHSEFGTDGTVDLSSAEIPRSYYGMIEIKLN